MDCNCIRKINEKLKEKNLQLVGYAFMMPGFKARITVKTDWVDKDKAPKGQKKRPTSIFVSHCPFCGKEYEKLEPEEV